MATSASSILILRIQERLAHGLQIARQGVDFGHLFAELHILCARIQRQLEDLVLVLQALIATVI